MQAPSGASSPRPEPGIRPPRTRRAGGLAVLGSLALVASLVAAAHWPVLAAQAMAMDDDAFFGSNPLVTRPGWASTARFFSEVLQPSTVRGYYLPLSMTSLMVDHALGGRPGDLGAFHRTNLALHVLSTALLVLLLHRLFGALAPAVVAGLLFGLHPLTVEPVAWVGERKTLLAACFALGSLLAYVQSTRRGGRGWTAGSVACFALALLSKPTVTPLPLLLLLLDAWPLRRLSARAVVEKWPFFALGLASVAITLVSHSRSAVILAAMPSELAHWPLHAGYLLAFYLGKLVAPADLTCVYPQPQPLALSNPAVALGVTVVVALAAGLLLLARRAPGPLVGAAFFVLAIAPTLGLVKYSWVVASDKYVYFPAVGLMLPIAAGLTILGARWGAGMRVWLLALPLAPLLLAEAHGVRATLRNWRDTPTLYRHMARLAPDAPEVMNGLARIAIAESRPDEALRYLSKSVAIEPGVAETRYNLGILLAARGETARALEHLRRAEALRPDDPEILGALGAALRAAGNGREAIPFLRRAVQVDPGFQQGLIALGQALVQEGQPEEGAPWLRRAFEGASDDAGLGYELAAALLLVPGATPEALTHLRRVVGLRPDWAPALNTLAWVLATTPDPALRDPGEARRLSARAVELTGGGRPEVLDTFAAALASAGEFAEAARVAERAARLAERGGAGALAREIRARLDLYRAGAAYVAPAEGSGGGPAS